MATYVELWNELKAWVPDLPPLLAKRLINRALLRIYDERPWSFNIRRGILHVPEAMTAGSVDVTNGSATVALDATANAALNGLSNPVVTQRQFRISFGPIYNIQAYDNGGATITLDRVYGEATTAGSDYNVYQCYFHAPDANFLRFISVVDQQNAYSLRLNIINRELDIRDPQRSTSGLAYNVASYRPVPPGYWDATYAVGAPMFELWPHMLTEKDYIVTWLNKGTTLSAASDVVPSSVSDLLVLSLAQVYAYQWAMGVNKPRQADYRAAMAQAMLTFRDELRDAKRQDDEIFQMNVVPFLPPGHYLDSDLYRQQHDLPARY